MYSFVLCFVHIFAGIATAAARLHVLCAHQLMTSALQRLKYQDRRQVQRQAWEQELCKTARHLVLLTPDLYRSLARTPDSDVPWNEHTAKQMP